MVTEILLPTWPLVVSTALVDSINPCAIGVLILLMSVLLGTKQSTGRLLLLGSLYILSILIVYLAAGLGLIYFFASIPLSIAEYISIAVGTLIIGAGILEIKDYFWYGSWFSLAIPTKMSKKLHGFAKKSTIPGVIFLGAFVAAVELPCTGAPYLAIITLLSQYFDLTALLLLILYNILFVSPLIVILLLVAGGKKLHLIERWRQKNRPFMRLVIGLTLVAMGWLLILIANGTINLG